jgi:hypothetical protein
VPCSDDCTRSRPPHAAARVPAATQAAVGHKSPRGRHLVQLHTESSIRGVHGSVGCTVHAHVPRAKGARSEAGEGRPRWNKAKSPICQHRAGAARLLGLYAPCVLPSADLSAAAHGHVTVAVESIDALHFHICPLLASEDAESTLPAREGSYYVEPVGVRGCYDELSC